MSFRTWTDILGHGAQVGVLRRICRGEKPAHAYLFEGPDGVGKRVVALALAARLMCESPDDAAGGCGDCRSCHALQRGEHPDLTLLERDGVSIRIAQVRTALKPLRFEPVLGQAKVLIVDEADTLREEAANALLKTLEEPPSRTHFILVTARPQLLLGTIRSRSQTVRFGDLDSAAIETLLVAEGVEQSMAAMAAPLAEGSVARARILCDPQWLAVVDRLTRFVLGLGTGNPLRVADAVVGVGTALEGLTLHASPEVQATAPSPTASAAEAKALARQDRRANSGRANSGRANSGRANSGRANSGSPAPVTPTKKDAAPATARLKGLDRIGLRWALDVTRTVLRDAMLLGSGVPISALPLARHGEALADLAERADPKSIAAAIDVCLDAEAAMVLNPNPRLALEAVWLEIDRVMR